MSTLDKSNQYSVMQFVLKFTMSAALIVWLINMIKWDQAFHMIMEGSPFYFALAFLVIQLTVASSVWKWKLLVYSKAIHNDQQSATFYKLGRFYYIGLFFNNFLPGSVGGDAVRIYYSGKIIGLSRAAASVALERITSGIALVTIVLAASLFKESVRPFLPSILVMAGVIIVLIYLLLLLYSKTCIIIKSEKIIRILGKVKKITETAKSYGEKSWKWWAAIALLSLLFQIGLVWINNLLFLGFGIEVSWIDLLVVITLISFITMIPISVNGIGVREASYVYFFREIGVPDEIAVSVSLIFFLFVTLSSLIGGVFWLSERRDSNEAIWEQVY